MYILFIYRIFFFDRYNISPSLTARYMTRISYAKYHDSVFVKDINNSCINILYHVNNIYITKYKYNDKKKQRAEITIQVFRDHYMRRRSNYPRFVISYNYPTSKQNYFIHIRTLHSIISLRFAGHPIDYRNI